MRIKCTSRPTAITTISSSVRTPSCAHLPKSMAPPTPTRLRGQSVAAANRGSLPQQRLRLEERCYGVRHPSYLQSLPLSVTAAGVFHSIRLTRSSRMEFLRPTTGANRNLLCHLSAEPSEPDPIGKRSYVAESAMPWEHSSQCGCLDAAAQLRKSPAERATAWGAGSLRFSDSSRRHEFTSDPSQCSGSSSIVSIRWGDDRIRDFTSQFVPDDVGCQRDRGVSQRQPDR